MFKQNFKLNGSFTAECQPSVVPHSLLALVNMVLEGQNIKHQTHLVTAASTTASLSISQLLMFNSVKHARAADTFSTVRHKHERETPLPLYITMKIHSVTHSRNLNLGMCVSYDRFLKLTSDISNGVCNQFTLAGVVCPLKLRSGLFTTAAVDNIYYNPSSATAKDSFHGTGISLIQHPSHEFEGGDRGVLVIDQTISATSRSVAPLPSKYTNVPPASFKSKVFTAPAVHGPVRTTTLQAFKEAKVGELEWLNRVMAALTKEQLDKMDWISWSAYHANIQEMLIPPAAINSLMPLFVDSAHSCSGHDQALHDHCSSSNSAPQPQSSSCSYS